MKKSFLIIIIAIGALAGFFSSRTPTIRLVFENIPFLLQGFLFLYLLYFTVRGGYPKAYQEDIKKHGKEKTLNNLKQIWIAAIFLPGSSHYLLGKTIKGILLFLIIETLSILALLNTSLTLTILAAGLWVYNIISAYKESKKARL